MITHLQMCAALWWVFPVFHWDKKLWMLCIQFDCHGVFIKFCRSWDGLFAYHGVVMPYFAFKRSKRFTWLDRDTIKPRRREQRLNRLWLPYLTIWHVWNYRDVMTITLPGQSDTLH